MSVVIDIDMPDKCLNCCPIYDDFNFYCKLYSYGIPARYNYDSSTRPEWCELIEINEEKEN